MTGFSGDDLLEGGLGADTMTDGYGDDVYVVNLAGDVVIEAALYGGTDMVVSGLATTTLGIYEENL